MGRVRQRLTHRFHNTDTDINLFSSVFSRHAKLKKSHNFDGGSLFYLLFTATSPPQTLEGWGGGHSVLNTWGLFFLKKTVLKPFCSPTFFEILLLKKVRFLLNSLHIFSWHLAQLLSQLHKKINWSSTAMDKNVKICPHSTFLLKALLTHFCFQLS